MVLPQLPEEPYGPPPSTPSQWPEAHFVAPSQSESPPFVVPGHPGAPSSLHQAPPTFAALPPVPPAVPVPPPPAGDAWSPGYLPAEDVAVRFAVGDITVLGDTVSTPSGQIPLSGSIWVATDQSRLVSKTPQWAVVVALLLAVFSLLISLLLLLSKERRVEGYVEVRVQSAGFLHVCFVPAQSTANVQYLCNHVAQIQAYAWAH